MQTDQVAQKLNLTVSQVRTIASNHNIKKCKKYLNELKDNLTKNRQRWFNDNIPTFKPSFLQEQIIFGSLLGDGYISTGSNRSVNCSYQEHFGESQRKYREWKLSYLNDLGFTINGNYLRSRSHPYFTSLYPNLYQNNIKILTKEFLTKCIHPLFLLTLYLDDGSLIISYQFNKTKNIVYCHPSIVLYTLNFTHDENEILASYLNETFGTHFVTSGHPDGNRTLLKLNKEKEVRYFLNLFSHYKDELNCMAYKMNLEKNIESKLNNIRNRYGKDVTVQVSSSNRRRLYSDTEIDIMIQLKKSGYTDQHIANKLGRTYWSIVYKISELRRNGLLS